MYPISMRPPADLCPIKLRLAQPTDRLGRLPVTIPTPLAVAGLATSPPGAVDPRTSAPAYAEDLLAKPPVLQPGAGSRHTKNSHQGD
jgi:hypothetical protein